MRREGVCTLQCSPCRVALLVQAQIDTARHLSTCMITTRVALLESISGERANQLIIKFAFGSRGICAGPSLARLATDFEGSLQLK